MGRETGFWIRTRFLISLFVFLAGPLKVGKGAAANRQDDGIPTAVPGSQRGDGLLYGWRIAKLHISQLLWAQSVGDHDQLFGCDQ